MCRSCQVERFKRRVDEDIVGHGFDPAKVETAMSEPDEEVICYYCGKYLEGQYNGDPPACVECVQKYNAHEGHDYE